MLLNFKKQFVPKILSGEKQHTIRATRKFMPKVGEICHLYTGLRQKGAQLLGRYPCVKVERISIYMPVEGLLHIQIDGQRLTADESDALAQRDGFANMPAMAAFWSKNNGVEPGGEPWHGHIIHWKKK